MHRLWCAQPNGQGWPDTCTSAHRLAHLLHRRGRRPRPDVLHQLLGQGGVQAAAGTPRDGVVRQGAADLRCGEAHAAHAQGCSGVLMCVHVCVRMCAQVCIHVCVFVSEYMYVCVCMHVCVCVCVAHSCCRACLTPDMVTATPSQAARPSLGPIALCTGLQGLLAGIRLHTRHSP